MGVIDKVVEIKKPEYKNIMSQISDETVERFCNEFKIAEKAIGIKTPFELAVDNPYFTQAIIVDESIAIMWFMSEENQGDEYIVSSIVEFDGDPLQRVYSRSSDAESAIGIAAGLILAARITLELQDHAKEIMNK